MSIKDEIYNIFNADGKILQIEYGLEAVNKSLPLVVLKNKNMIVCAAKKNQGHLLEDEVQTSFQPIYPNLYSAFTGNWADVFYVNSKAKDLAHYASYKLGFSVTPDILCRKLADELQPLIQSTGERAPAFAGALFGFDNGKPVVYMTNISAVCYPVYGSMVGSKNQNMYKYVEKYYNEDIEDEKLFEVAVGGLLESLGENSVYQEMEVAYLRNGEVLKYLDDKEIESLLLSIADK
ncbi:proteasome subunit PSA1 (PSA1) [Vairimorpha necatrix]|uniref:Proteasome subunit PSA1 (PSA1) n=1 Tax=Vairimorpha necatrix TaxID=6039 RepID=A0AAX4JEG3_9MICR|nr:Chain G, Proteasome subunit alpha type-1 [Vairimorpha necatrix]8ADN_U Chain U, Proteasome subunit alpha type-1 [Vairimorpha necatrix]